LGRDFALDELNSHPRPLRGANFVLDVLTIFSLETVKGPKGEYLLKSHSEHDILNVASIHFFILPHPGSLSKFNNHFTHDLSLAP